MKRLIAVFAVFFIVFGICTVSIFAEESEIEIYSLKISDDKTQVQLNARLNTFAAENNDILYLFSVPLGADEEDSVSFIQISSAEVSGTEFSITFPFSANDTTSLFSGYLLATKNEKGDLVPLTAPMYIQNASDIAENNKQYNLPISKKGLQVQLTADAQLLGVKHTVINAFINDLVPDTKGTNPTVSFIYGGTEYSLDKNALSMLDYRVKTLTDAGIHIYMNLLLGFDTGAPDNLYYANAEGSVNTLYAVNMSDTENIKRIAALVHFLADRYSEDSSAYGFCGSFILGYEANDQSDSNSAGIPELSKYAKEYAKLLRVSDIAAKSAYKNARIFVSLSNSWMPTSESAKNNFGAKEFLTELNKHCSDIPFGVSVNPYLSDISSSTAWIDENAENDPDTDYIAISNLSVLTDFVNSGDIKHPIIVGEFGVSGRIDDITEKQQAASYLYSYCEINKNESVESLIWHRHVDHVSEPSLYFGLYSSGDLLLEPAKRKLIYEAMHAADTDDIISFISENKLFSEIPEIIHDEMMSFYSADNVIRIIEFLEEDSIYKLNPASHNRIFDFSKSLYSFYPSDNSSYLEQCEEKGNRFMRIALITVANIEYMGAGCAISQFSDVSESEYMTVKLRVTSNERTADVKLLISSENDGKDIIIDCSSSVECNEWTELTFELTDTVKSLMSGKKCRVKILTKGEFDNDGSSFLDVQYLCIGSRDSSSAIVRTFVAAIIAVLIILAAIAVFFIYQKKRSKDPLP